MAIIYGRPEELPPPPEFDTDEPVAVYFDRQNKWIESVAEWCRQNSGSKLAGEEIRFPVGDGYAHYLVLRLKPAELVWLEVGDAWRAHRVLEKGLDSDEIQKEVNRQRRLAELFGAASKYRKEHDE